MTLKEFTIVSGIAAVGAAGAVVWLGWMGGIGFTLALILLGLQLTGNSAALPALAIGALITLLGYFNFVSKVPDPDTLQGKADMGDFLTAVISAPASYGLTEADSENLLSVHVSCTLIDVKALQDLAIAGQEAVLPPFAPVITEPLKKMDDSPSAPPKCEEVIAELSRRSPKFKEELDRYLEIVASS